MSQVVSIHERKYYVCIAHLDPKASEEEEQNSSLTFDAGKKFT